VVEKGRCHVALSGIRQQDDDPDSGIERSTHHASLAGGLPAGTPRENRPDPESPGRSAELSAAQIAATVVCGATYHGHLP
jgi:hypothetical protein